VPGASCGAATACCLRVTFEELQRHLAVGGAAAAGGASPWGELLLRAEPSQRREPRPRGGATTPRRAVASAAAAAQARRSLLPADPPRRSSRTAQHPRPWRVDRPCGRASVSMGAAANHGCGHRRRRHYLPSCGSRPPQPRVVGGGCRISFTSSAAAALPPPSHRCRHPRRPASAHGRGYALHRRPAAQHPCEVQQRPPQSDGHVPESLHLGH